VSHVFNYNVPRHADDYVHRIGRTARAGRKGDAITIVSPEDRKSIAAVEALIKQAIPTAEHIVVADVPRASREDARESRSSGRGRRAKGRGPRARSSEEAATPAKAPEPVATAKPLEPVAAAKSPERPERAERQRRSEPPSEARTSKPAKPAKPPRRGGREPRRQEAAFGEHTPAFLLRAGPAPK
jgi:superfamily II DNA/RNA helicase